MPADAKTFLSDLPAALHQRVVVISPHLDDAALSLGAAIDHAVRGGWSVDVVTVFAGDASSRRRAGRWDRRAGFRLEGEAASARRVEDASACRVLGAQPVWLDFGDEQYARRRDGNEILDAVVARTRGADHILVPGYPLRHADHRFVAEILCTADLGAAAISLYAEQPYADLGTPTPDPDAWHALTTPIASIRAKRDACEAYSSQLPLLPKGMLEKIANEQLERTGETVRAAPGAPSGHALT